MSLNRRQILHALRQRGCEIRSIQAASGMCAAMTDYVLDRRPLYAEMAAIAHRSGRTEVSLAQVDNTFFLSNGAAGMTRVSTRLLVHFRNLYQASIGIERFLWLAHTHPLDRSDRYQHVSYGATREDREVLRLLNAVTGQTVSRVVLCRGGALAPVNNGQAVVEFGFATAPQPVRPPRSSASDFPESAPIQAPGIRLPGMR